MPGRSRRRSFGYPALLGSLTWPCACFRERVQPILGRLCEEADGGTERRDRITSETVIAAALNGMAVPVNSRLAATSPRLSQATGLRRLRPRTTVSTDSSARDREREKRHFPDGFREFGGTFEDAR